jgi:pimeloyl-ACP methyl ester carboxylesterase
MTRTIRALVAALVVAVGGAGMATSAAGAGPGQAVPGGELLPIVFVHGQSGSVQQFETQALRFTSNGYPQELLYAFEYDTTQSTNPLEDLDDFVDGVLAETGAEKVYAIGHSRGTSVWTSYLSPEEGGIDGSTKVAKYVNIDGRDPEELPGGVPTIGIWGEWNTAGSPFNRNGGVDAQIGPDPEDNFHFGDKSHTEVATSPEAFALMFEFFTGGPPATTAVVPEPPGQVEISGRAVLFPENVGYAGSLVQVWRIDPATGQRIADEPRATFPIDETGDWGPVSVNPRHRYELTIVRPDTGNQHHFYPEPFLRSDHFVRLNSALPDGQLDAITPDSDETTNLVILRMKEFWGDQGADSDQVLVNGLNILTPQTSPRSAVNLAAFVQDDGLDGQTDLGKGELFPFGFVSFLTAVDVSLSASPDADGVITVTEVPRDGGDVSVTNVPNWPSSTNAVTVPFRDAATADTFPLARGR